MPTYEYACRGCEHRFEIVQSFSDAALTSCDKCGGELRKVFSAAGLIFKGSGWHIKDYSSSAGGSSTSGSSGSAGSSTSKSGAESSASSGGSSSSGSSTDAGSSATPAAASTPSKPAAKDTSSTKPAAAL